MDSVRDPNLAKYISTCGVASRRGAVELIRAGRVCVNGIEVSDPAVRIAPGEKVEVDGNLLSLPDSFVYIMLNKPRGYVCSNADAHAEKLALDLVRDASPRLLRSAGRLDRDSEGLIIFSDDGAYLERAAHPRYQVCKLYEVSVERQISGVWIKKMLSGIVDNGERLRVLEVLPLGGRKYRFKLNEGKKREIRRLCYAAGAPVKRLKRVAVGELLLGNLATGAYRKLTPAEVALSLVADPGAAR